LAETRKISVNQHKLVLKHPYTVNQLTTMNTATQLSPAEVSSMTEFCRFLDTKIARLQSKDFVLGEEPKVFLFGGHNNKRQIASFMDEVSYKPGNFADMVSYNNSLGDQRPLFLIALGTEIEGENGPEAPRLCNADDNPHVIFERVQWEEWNSQYHFIGIRK
jgi:hypothetical protein